VDKVSHSQDFIHRGGVWGEGEMEGWRDGGEERRNRRGGIKKVQKNGRTNLSDVEK